MTFVGEVEFEFNAFRSVTSTFEEGVLLAGVLVSGLHQLDSLGIHFLYVLDFPTVHEPFFLYATRPVHFSELSLVGSVNFCSHVALLRSLPRCSTGQAIVGVGDVENRLFIGWTLEFFSGFGVCFLFEAR